MNRKITQQRIFNLDGLEPCCRLRHSEYCLTSVHNFFYITTAVELPLLDYSSSPVVDKNNCVNSEVLAQYNSLLLLLLLLLLNKENISRGMKKGTCRLCGLFYVCEIRPNPNSTARVFVSPWKVKRNIIWNLEGKCCCYGLIEIQSQICVEGLRQL